MDSIAGFIKYLHPIYKTLIIYIVLLIVMRVMGKREVGKLSPFDFVVAIVIAELAAIPMGEDNINLLHGIIPIVTLLLAEIFISWLSLKSYKARKFINGTPSIIVQQGKILEKEMRKIRYNINDLLSQLREKGYPNIADIEYAILENSGHLSVIPKSTQRPVTPADLDMVPPQEILPIVLISDGVVLYENLNFAGVDRLRLKEELIEQNIKDPKDVFLACLDGKGKLIIALKDKFNSF